MAHLKNKTAHAIRTRSPPRTVRSLQGGGLVAELMVRAAMM